MSDNQKRDPKALWILRSGSVDTRGRLRQRRADLGVGDTGYSQTDVRLGTGAEAVNGSLLTVQYTGWLYDADESRRERAPVRDLAGTGPAVRVHHRRRAGDRRLGPGADWNEGIGLRRLVLPPSLAYGSGRNGPIPPNATLVFDIELLNVQ